MMEDPISIAWLNDYIFCPYSIYLHNVYMESDEDVYKATPQLKGTLAHRRVDAKTTSTHQEDFMGLTVYSDALGVTGKIDIYKKDQAMLVEWKNNLKNIYQGQLYQLWAQYFCMIEMGFTVKKLAFYEIMTHKMIPIQIPGDEQYRELKHFLEEFRVYDPLTTAVKVNINKCRHCIYSNLCDKTSKENVY